MTECINEEILKEFLEKNRAEVIKVCLYEYNQNLMKNTGWNAKEAMKALGIPEEEQEKYQSKLQEGQ